MFEFKTLHGGFEPFWICRIIFWDDNRVKNRQAPNSIDGRFCFFKIFRFWNAKKSYNFDRVKSAKNGQELDENLFYFFHYSRSVRKIGKYARALVVFYMKKHFSDYRNNTGPQKKIEEKISESFSAFESFEARRIESWRVLNMQLKDNKFEVNNPTDVVENE